MILSPQHRSRGHLLPLFLFALLQHALLLHAQSTSTRCVALTGNYICATAIPNVSGAYRTGRCSSQYNFVSVPSSASAESSSSNSSSTFAFSTATITATCCRAVTASASAIIVPADASLGIFGPLSNNSYVDNAVVPGVPRTTATLLAATEDPGCNGGNGFTELPAPGATTVPPAVVLPGVSNTSPQPGPVILPGVGAPPVLPSSQQQEFVVLPAAGTDPPATTMGAGNVPVLNGRTAAPSTTGAGVPVLAGSTNAPGSTIPVLPGDATAPTVQALPGSANARSSDDEELPVLPGSSA